MREIEIKTLTDTLTPLYESHICKINRMTKFEVVPEFNRITFIDSQNKIIRCIQFDYKIDSIKLR
jgi:hypothetical protein